MDKIGIEVENLKKENAILLDENKKLKIKLKNINDFNTNKQRYKILLELRAENDDLKRKLEEKYDNCMKEKQSLKDEIEELKKLLEGGNESKRRKIVHVSA